MVRSLRCALLVAAVAGCAPSPRGQVTLYVQTDLPVPRFADTLRIERLDSQGRSIEARSNVAADPQDWPISLGIAATGGTVRLRLRLFPSLV